MVILVLQALRVILQPPLGKACAIDGVRVAAFPPEVLSGRPEVCPVQAWTHEQDALHSDQEWRVGRKLASPQAVGTYYSLQHMLAHCCKELPAESICRDTYQFISHGVVDIGVPYEGVEMEDDIRKATLHGIEKGSVRVSGRRHVG